MDKVMIAQIEVISGDLIQWREQCPLWLRLCHCEAYYRQDTDKSAQCSANRADNNFPKTGCPNVQGDSN